MISQNKESLSLTRVSLAVAIVIFLIGLIYFFELPQRLGFPKTWAIDCGCLGIKNKFTDIEKIPRCSCYGYTTWVWLE
ncbi:MAG: hypothetical protein ACD_52C00324G0002 [uncultured bacterium]|uniref:Uncharacterized protein n=1 Tax=Candidatus Woesebacteria bacterium RIFCSPHIGHO2_12_FULL_41_24 TaxID=1802510 RepID=A0A1F8AV16_9BACT|nr:MAG: hypothetical protein ACD_52C00324G0002 [uncultured bacterium]OGM14628.1 MAG: hypothetical protein A2W15_01540 [Candidatus Woesebacteria bacterium RBG_16_41_13]OGM30815.1 MAG: hypothetical protein A2873_04125 [Candidatus Woesebacteria bacterium RIFCSPHIGHO2_01_FULL_42_80]OGM34270.1 MAG: hypothetical protein A3D84_00040 [Candidatus Woesebacteria bacterium RIFCSPHIGHO2_02_FULL_42_20]OGM55065.1 MAG: hypothetical protein A3E44_04050 [Candidatus Woesebacteria bacterium RIFCSPHIGHO2_12_FULL_41